MVFISTPVALGCSIPPHLNACATVLRASKKRLGTAKEHMFRDSQKLYALRQEEANLIAEICGAQVGIVE